MAPQGEGFIVREWQELRVLQEQGQRLQVLQEQREQE